jgi:hypothetical protein
MRISLAKLMALIRYGSWESYHNSNSEMVIVFRSRCFEDGTTTPPFENLYFDSLTSLECAEIDSLSRYQYSLLGAIQTLRMLSNGSFGGVEHQKVEAIYNLLCGRFDNWNPGSDPYSEHVKKMLELTLEQYRNSFWRKQHGI